MNQNLNIENITPKFATIGRTNKAVDTGGGRIYNEAGTTYNQAGQTYGGIYGADVEKLNLNIINI